MPDRVVELAPMAEFRSKILRVGRFEISNFYQVITVGSDGIIAIFEGLLPRAGA